MDHGEIRCQDRYPIDRFCYSATLYAGIKVGLFFNHTSSAAVRLRLVSIAIGAIVSAWAIPLRAEECIILDNFSSSTPHSFPKEWKPREEAGKNVYVVSKEGDMSFVRGLQWRGFDAGHRS